MLKYYRYMSKVELDKLMAGETIRHTNGRIGDSEASDTDMCFLGEFTPIPIYLPEEDIEYEALWSAIQCYKFLSGVVSDEFLVEFETEHPLKQGSGRYADPNGNWDDFFSILGPQRITIPEFYTESYSKRTMRPTRFVSIQQDDVAFRMYFASTDEADKLFKPIGEYIL